MPLSPRIPRTVPGRSRVPPPHRPARTNRRHREFVGGLPCCVCGADHAEVAHVRTGTDGGMGLKPSDRFTVPLCRRHHDLQHQVGDTAFWGAVRIDPTGLANHLWTNSGSIEAGLRAVAGFAQRASLAWPSIREARTLPFGQRGG